MAGRSDPGVSIESVRIEIDVDDRRAINDGAPVNSLPNELLCNIFHRVRNLWERGDVERWRCSLYLFYITHTCHRWRSIALADASLWARLPILNSPSWIETIVERAKDVPMDVRLDSSAVDTEVGTFVLREHLPRRIAKLEFNIAFSDDDVFEEWMEGIAGVPAHGLQELAILLADFSNFFIVSLLKIPKNAILSPDRLQTLRLYNVNIEWDSHLLGSSLTSLYIENTIQGVRATPQHFLDMLKRMPRLKSLTIHCALLPAPRLIFPDHEYVQVFLPRLEHLSLCAEIKPLRWFADNVIPTRRLRHISLKPYESDFDMTNIISDLAMSSTPDEIHRLSVQFAEETDWTLAFKLYSETDTFVSLDGGPLRDRDDSGSGSGPGTPALCFATDVFRPDSTSSYIPGLFRQMFASFQWTHLVELDLTRLGPGSELTPSVLGRTFARVPSLRMVAVGTFTGLLLLEVLRESSVKPLDAAASSSSSSSSSSTGANLAVPIAFPGLQQIRFVNADFVDPWRGTSERRAEPAVTRPARPHSTNTIVITTVGATARPPGTAFAAYHTAHAAAATTSAPTTATATPATAPAAPATAPTTATAAPAPTTATAAPAPAPALAPATITPPVPITASHNDGIRSRSWHFRTGDGLDSEDMGDVPIEKYQDSRTRKHVDARELVRCLQLRRRARACGASVGVGAQYGSHDDTLPGESVNDAQGHGLVGLRLDRCTISAADVELLMQNVPGCDVYTRM